MLIMTLDYFPCRNSYLKKCEKLTDQELGRLFRALMTYNSTGERQELAGRESIAFDFIADDIDTAKEAYAKKCEENSRKGKKGGRPKKQELSEKAEKATAFSESQKSKDKIKNKEKEKIVTPLYSPAVASVLSDYLNRINPSASPMSLDELKGYAEEMGEAVCKRAFDIALDSKKATWPYIRAILRDKLANGVKCLADWDALEERRPKQGKSGNTGVKYDYSDKGDSL